jgi:hypothetical protein
MRYRSLIVGEASSEWRTPRPDHVPVCPPPTHEIQNTRPEHTLNLIMKRVWMRMRAVVWWNCCAGEEGVAHGVRGEFRRKVPIDERRRREEEPESEGKEGSE